MVFTGEIDMVIPPAEYPSLTEPVPHMDAHSVLFPHFLWGTEMINGIQELPA
jgi:hypothetical protein